MPSKMIAALIGAGIALVGGIVGAFLQHFLNLRFERKKMEWQAEKDGAQELRHRLLDTALSPGLSPAMTEQLQQWSRLMLVYQSAANAAGQLAMMAAVEREQQASEERRQELVEEAQRDHLVRLIDMVKEMHKIQMQTIDLTQQLLR